MLITDSGAPGTFAADMRVWQGIPGIERTRKGRLFATFYSGSTREGFGNYCVLLMSDDDGASWTEPIAVAYAGENARCYDPCLWIDPIGRLWFIWAVMPDHGVWASVCDDPDAAVLAWSEPRRIGRDVMMNKPTVLSDGSWLFPMAVWREGVFVMPDCVSDGEERLSFVYRTCDGGETFTCIGGADVPDRSFDEHMVVELTDGRLWMLVRTHYGIGQSFSSDGGRTWTEGEDSGLGGPCSRFFVRRLASGRLLLVNHAVSTGRSHLTAYLSEDDGKTWPHALLLDDRSSIAYPDGVQTAEGVIYITYDRERGGFKSSLAEAQSEAREILMARITEEDIMAGRPISEGSRLRQVISRLGEYRGTADLYARER